MEPLNYNQPWTQLIEHGGVLEEMFVILQSHDRVIINNHPWFLQEQKSKRKFILRLEEADKRVWVLTRVNPAHENPGLWHLRLDQEPCPICEADFNCDMCKGTGLIRVNS